MRYGLSRINYGRFGWRSGGLVIKFASLENMLMAATLVMITVFVVWSVKILVT